jgi:hypothetical protein
LTTHWRQTTTREVGIPRADVVSADHNPREAGVLVHDGIPDWVKVPDESPVAAGSRRRVAAVNRAPCPMPGCGVPCVHLHLQGPADAPGRRLRVACCNAHGFVCFTVEKGA